MKQTEKDRKDEARAGHRVNEARDARERKDRKDDAAGGRKANEALRAERVGLKDARGVDEAGAGMAGDGHIQRSGQREYGPQCGTGGATGSPAPKIGKIPAGHGPE